jgi:hypothetical protein
VRRMPSQATREQRPARPREHAHEKPHAPGGAAATSASSHAVSATPASASVRLGSSSSTAAFSSAAAGLRAPHATSRSVTSEGSTSIFACEIQRMMKSSTVCSTLTSFTATYRAPATSVRLTHAVTATSADACGRDARVSAASKAAPCAQPHQGSGWAVGCGLHRPRTHHSGLPAQSRRPWRLSARASAACRRRGTLRVSVSITHCS